MPRKRKERPDEIDVKLLTTLYYLKNGTVYQLEKHTGISKATISDRLKWLEEKGYLEKPKEEINQGRFKKIYKAPSKEKILKAIMESENITSLDILKERFVKREIYLTLGYDLADFKDWSEDEIGMFDYTKMFVWEYFGLLEIKKEGNGYLFKLTKKGMKEVTKTYEMQATTALEDLRDFDFETYVKLLEREIEDLRKINKETIKNLISKLCEKET